MIRILFTVAFIGISLLSFSQATIRGFVYNKENVATWMPATDYLKGDLVEYKNFYYAASKNLPGTDEFDFSTWLPVDKSKIKTGLLSNFARNSSLSKNFYNVDRVNLENEFDFFYDQNENLICLRINDNSNFTGVHLTIKDCINLIDDLTELVNKIEGGNYE